MSKKVFFLDRDGVLNEDRGYIFHTEDWQWRHGVIEGLQKLQQAGFTLVIITNQSGIGRGYYSEDDMKKLHDWVVEELKKSGVTIAAIAYCPHAPEDDCNCRKPKRGMVDQVIEKIGEIDFSQSWVIGDKEKDIELGQTIGAKTVLVRSKYWNEPFDSAPTNSAGRQGKPDLIVDSLLEAAQQI